MPELIVRVLGDVSNLEKSLQKGTKSATTFTKGMKNVERGTLSATASFVGLRRAVLSTSAAFLGGVGLVSAFKSTVKAAEESQAVLAQTRNAVKNAGLNWQAYGKQIQAAALAQSQLSGFDDERLLGTFSNLVRRTNDVNEALKLNALAANVARGRHIELEAAQALVLKASIGQVGALRRLGINLDKNATSVQALDLLQRKYAGSAAAYGRTAAGAQDRFRVALQNLQETVGAQLLPSVTKYLNKGADWLNQSKNQKRIADDLHAAVSGVTAVVDTLKTAFDGLTKATGGTRNALYLLASAFAALKLKAAIGSLFSTSTAMRGIGAAAETSAARVSLLRGALLRLGAIGAITVGIDLLINRKGIDKSVSGFLDKHGLPGGTNNISIQDVVAGAQGNGPFSKQFQDFLRTPAGQKAAAAAGLLAGPPAPGAGRGSGTDRIFKLLLPGHVSGSGSTPKPPKPFGIPGFSGSFRSSDLGPLNISPFSGSFAANLNPSVPGALGGRGAFARQFNIPAAIQLAIAKADAIGNQSGIIAAAKSLRSFAQRALKTGHYALSAQIDAWNAIAQANNTLKNNLKSSTANFRHVSTLAVAQALGFHGAGLKAAREKLAVLGPGNTVPNRGPAFAGAGAINFYGDVHVGVRDVREFESEMRRRAKSRPTTRRGAR